MKLALLSVFLALPVLAACRAPQVPTPDASDAAPPLVDAGEQVDDDAAIDDLSARACKNANRQGCAQAPDCAPAMREALIVTHAVTAAFLTCLATQQGRFGIIGCGPQVRCDVAGR